MTHCSGRRAVVVALILSGLAVTLQGCASFEQYMATVFEGPAQKVWKLDAPVDETGIVLVKAELIDRDLFGEHSYDITAASLTPTSGPEQVIRVSKVIRDSQV